MGSRASTQHSLPGPPQQVELAYLAGLVDRSGGFTASRPNTIGLKVTCSPALRRWLLMRFGGFDTSRCWWLTRRADLAYVITHMRPFLVVRGGQAEAMSTLLDHLNGRDDYHGSPEWRRKRVELMSAVRARSPANA